MHITPLFHKVILLEDDDSHALLIKRALAPFVKELNHHTTLAQTLEFLKSQSIDLIITDLHLPDSQGAGHVESIRAKTSVPVIVLTSSTSLKDAIAAMQRGAHDFIVKNFDNNFGEVLRLSLSRIFTSIEMQRDKVRMQGEMDTLRVAIENSIDGLAIAGKDGVITYSNRSFESFLGLCGGNNKDLLSIFSDKVNKKDDLIKSLRNNVQKVVAGAVWHSEITFKETPDVAYDLILSTIGSAKGSEANEHFAVWVKDISEQKRREKFQREILSTTTHDLKGPLGAIMISCELLAEMVKDRPKVSELVLRVDSAARGSVNLIDEFLSARRIQEGTFILRPSQQPIAPIIEEAAEDYKTIAASRSITLEIEPVVPFEASVDKLGFKRVLGNLLSNALKFTPKGGTVRVRTWKAGEHFHLEVIDSGSGMEPAEVQKIFDRFSRLDKHRDIGGSGIGLFVVKSIVTAHGGTIEVTSKAGEGTSFDISFPINPPVNSRGELISLDFT